jgi:hypothetical protein
MSFKIVSNVNIDEITFNILEFSLGEKLVVSVNFLDKKIIQKTSTYTFTYSNTVPSRYNYSSTFPFPYYLPDDVTVDLSSFSNKLFDIYIINGLILPSIKYYEKILTDINDLTAPLSAPTFNIVKDANTPSFKVEYTNLPNKLISKSYLYIDGPTGSNTYSIDGPTGSISQSVTDNSQYYIYTSTSNPYTGTTGTLSIFPTELIPINGPVGSISGISATGPSGGTLR